MTVSIHRAAGRVVVLFFSDPTFSHAAQGMGMALADGETLSGLANPSSATASPNI